MTFKTNYNLRPLTVTNSANHLTSPKSSRKVLTPSKSATLTKSPTTHDCETVETDHTTNKVAARLFHSLFRFSLAHAYNCTTRRGTTHLNGAKSTCGGCEAAHAALSPTLYDDILNIIQRKFGDKNLSELDLKLRKYLEARFSLTEEDKENLLSESKETRENCLSKLMSRLTLQETKGSFVNTATEYQRNATFENPRASNKVDCYLEHHLRPLEDLLSGECTIDAKAPAQALEELQKAHRELLEIALKNIKAKQLLLNDFHLSFTQLSEAETCLDMKADDKATTEFKNQIKKYQQLYDEFFTRQQGAPSFKSFKKHIDDEQSPHVLQALLKIDDLNLTREYYESFKQFLKKSSNVDSHFETAKKELELRALEAENQLKVLCQTPDDIKMMYKHQFGTQDASGVLRTPNKDDTAKALAALVGAAPKSQAK